MAKGQQKKSQQAGKGNGKGSKGTINKSSAWGPADGPSASSADQVEMMLSITGDLRRQIEKLATTVSSWEKWWQAHKIPDGCVSIPVGGDLDVLHMKLPAGYDKANIEFFASWHGNLHQGGFSKQSKWNWKVIKESDVEVDLMTGEVNYKASNASSASSATSAPMQIDTLSVNVPGSSGALRKRKAGQ